VTALAILRGWSHNSSIDVIAHSGSGDLLGNLVTDVSHLFDNFGHLPTALSQRLDRIAELIVADAGLLGLLP
jgi:hypothetical protein